MLNDFYKNIDSSSAAANVFFTFFDGVGLGA